MKIYESEGDSGTFYNIQDIKDFCSKYVDKIKEQDGGILLYCKSNIVISIDKDHGDFCVGFSNGWDFNTTASLYGSFMTDSVFIRKYGNSLYFDDPNNRGSFVEVNV